MITAVVEIPMSWNMDPLDITPWTDNINGRQPSAQDKRPSEPTGGRMIQEHLIPVMSMVQVGQPGWHFMKMGLSERNGKEHFFPAKHREM